MSAKQTLLTSIIEEETKRLEDAVRDVKALLQYQNEYFTSEYVGRIRTLTYRLLTCRQDVLYDALGYSSRNDYCYFRMWGSDVVTKPVARMEFVRFFVSHEILDDGEPGVAYYTLRPKDPTRPLWEGIENPRSCGPEEPGATPYFHSHIDTLREDFPEAKWLDSERALEVLDSLEEKHQQTLKNIEYLHPNDKTRHNLNKTEQLMLDLANEIQKETN
ncbi:MAG: hypothetical protein OEY01_03830 [Desulfobulbaceae bacterium]|nr:hypothetical protein [Desulfobulbaceae bacterium]